jgi:pilus assembly protein CpaE
MAEKILVVDDDIDTLRLVGLMLERQGYQIIAASTGQQALSLARVEKPDLILLDLMMPDIDGFETLRRLRSLPAGQDLPVVVVTAMPDPDIDQRVARAGGNATLRKPVDFDTLAAAIDGHLRRA